MGSELQYGPSEQMLSEYSHIGLWRWCPIALVGTLMHLARGQIMLSKRLGRTYSVDSGLEKILSSLFLEIGVNLTEYFHPLQLSPAPFYHIHRLVRSIEVDVDTRAWSQSDARLSGLREAIASDESLPESAAGLPLRGSLEAMRSCSLGGLAVGLAPAAAEHMALNDAHFGGASQDPILAARFHARLNRAQRCLQRLARGGNLLSRVLAEGAPLFGVLDRIDCRTPVLVDGEPPLDNSSSVLLPGFVMHVLPMRDFESNWMRSYGRFHCDADFKAILLRRHAEAPEDVPFMLGEVGAYLGGCSFWALMHLPRLRVVAVEQFQPAAAAMRRTGITNRLGTDTFEVVEACVSDGASPFLRSTLMRDGDLLQPAVASSAGTAPVAVAPRMLTATTAAAALAEGEEGRECRTLDDILGSYLASPSPQQRWGLVRVHTSGMELPILRSGLATLRQRGVRTLVAVLTSAHSAEDHVEIAALLAGAGAMLSCGGKILATPEDAPRICDSARQAANLVADFAAN
eukprot:TRINITY_DN54727_c0_g1_i1.p1 TRINITY_DN54727_c0_g1~~TRINITY_DN54727_c0_g1_i1.p1  ORF type:complete len:540 (-),score=101.29 TRINITY_DN54727_c0_g1_i1:628-2175(-)